MQTHHLHLFSLKSGGVKIELPAAQLKSVMVGGASTAQILDGFTALDKIEAVGASTLTAMSSVSSTTSMRVYGASTVTMSTSAQVEGEIEGASTVSLETPTFDNFIVEGASTVGVKGNLGSGSVSGASTVTVTGTTESVNADGASTIEAQSCENVSTSGASSCESGSQEVSVDATEQSMTSSGTFTCGYGGSWCSGNGCNAGHASAVITMAGGTIIAVAVMFAAFI